MQRGINKTPERESPFSEPHVARHSIKTSLPIVPLPDHIGQNIEAIVALHTSAERDVPRQSAN